MGNVQQYLIFASAAQLRSFAQAARAHGVTPSTVAKSVQRLERELGVRLFHRTTRQVSLTPEGEAVFANCRRLLAEFERLQDTAADARGAPRGLLRVSLPLAYGREVILPLLADLVVRHPLIELDVQFGDQYVDLVRDGYDAAVRVGVPQDANLVGRRIDCQQLLLCASPSYLEAAGTPRSVADLAAHRAVVFRMPTSGRDRPWLLRQARREIEIQPQATMRCNDGEAMVRAACAGLGLVQVPHYMAAAALDAGALVEVLPRQRPTPTDILVVYPSARQLAPRVRALVDALVAAQLDHGKAKGVPSGR